MSKIATSAPARHSGSSEFFAAIVQIFHPSAHVMLTIYKVIASLIGDGRDGIAVLLTLISCHRVMAGHWG